MITNNLTYQRVKKKYLNYLKSQEALSEPFRDKLSQLDNFFIPLTQMIFKNYSKNLNGSPSSLSDEEDINPRTSGVAFGSRKL